MSYATVQDLISRYGELEIRQLTDRAEPPADVVDPDVAQKALDDASATIDSYLSQAYALPLATTPSVLTDYCQTIARYKLHREPTESVRADYKDALIWLGQVAKGQAGLPGIEPTKAGGVSGAVLVRSGDRHFTRDTMGGF